jgi:hypothetical protein
LVLLSGFTLAQDNTCPAYPTALRAADREALRAGADYASFVSDTERLGIVPTAKNFIDTGIFKKMSDDGIDAAPLSNDNEFVRRIYVDLTGRIPTYEQATAFLASTDPNKRAALIEELLASSAYVDQLSKWFLDRFQVRPNGNQIGVPSAINFYNYIRDFVQSDRPYDGVVREMLTVRGDSDVEPPIAFLAKQQVNPVQDTWDNTLNIVTTQFLGIRTECVSCHNGRGHLESINLDLTQHTRRDFWKMSAFFSRMRMRTVSDDNGGFRQRVIISNDTSVGQYTSAVDPSNPGARPSRDSANEAPYYWLTGKAPQSADWRREFAGMVTSDPQFAKASVNYIWAYFFGSGIVDPVDGWDLQRTDPNIPLPDGWPTQNSHPDVLNALADYFVQNNYSVKSVVRLIVNSNAYQLSSRYPDGKWQDAYKDYFARYEARRMTAEQLLDSLSAATGILSPMSVIGLPNVLQYTNQIPYPNATNDGGTEFVLSNLGRSDYNARIANSKPSLLGVLDFMNNYTIEVRTRAYSNRYSPQSRLSVWFAEGLSEPEIVQRMFMSTLTRPPTAAELDLALNRKSVDASTWFSGLQWALIQKSDFVFKY